MKNIQFSTPETDRKVGSILFSLAVFTAVGYLLPAPVDFPCIHFMDALIGVALGILVWGMFNLLEPTRRYNHKWAIAKSAGIPFVWLLLLLLLTSWFHHLDSEFMDYCDAFINRW